MNIIIKVAKTELRTLFYSPIAWFLMIVFFVQCGFVYTGALEGAARQQEIGGQGLKYMMNLTERIFLSSQGLFGSVMQNLYLYIPLLTMSLISRETGSGTIKLLYSSPIKVREIVFGKYLAMMAYSLLLVIIVGIFIVSGVFHIQYPQTGMLMTAMLGFFLLLCAYSAIGLFMSCLTTYQVVAAICTFVMIGILSYIGNLWQSIAFVRELTYFLSINGRTQKMLAGLVTTKDIVYFLVIVYIFLGLSIYKLKAGMESKPASVKTMRYVAIVASALLIGYISSLPGFIGYFDATNGKKRTLTPRVQQIVAELGDAPLEITAYNNLLGQFWFMGSPESYNQNLARWEPYMRFKPSIRLKTVLYYDSTFDSPYMMSGYPGKNLRQIAEQYTKSQDLDLKDFKTPGEIKQLIDLKPELNRYVMKLKWKDRTTWLRVFNDQAMWPSETEVAAAFKRLLQAKLPKIGFVTGHLERAIDKKGDKDYQTLTSLKTFRYAFINQGFDVDTISLDTREIPQDITTLVIADPKLGLGAAGMTRLQQYIDKGGNLLVAGEPGRQAVLNPLLGQWGVQMMEGQIVQQSQDFSPDLAMPQVTAAAYRFTKQLSLMEKDSLPVTMPGVAALSYTGNSGWFVQPLLLSDSKLSWNKKQKLDLDLVTSADAGPKAGLSMTMMAVPVAAIPDHPASKTAFSGTVSFSADEGDARGAFPTVISLSRKINGKEQRIIVAGDADFLSNAELNRNNMRNANFAFNTALFSWLSYGEFPVDASRPEAQDTSVNVSLKQVKFFRILYIWILPAILLIFGTVLLIRRKRK